MIASKVSTFTSILAGILTEYEARQIAAPDLASDELHPWIAGAVAGLWEDGYHRQAVDEATRSVEIRLKSKVGREDLAGVALVTEAFSVEPPRPGAPRLRFPSFEQGTLAWTNAHEGALHYARGCVMRIRNLYEHHDEEPDRQVALESLAALSLLARWIDEADVEQASGRPPST